MASAGVIRRRPRRTIFRMVKMVLNNMSNRRLVFMLAAWPARTRKDVGSQGIGIIKNLELGKRNWVGDGIISNVSRGQN